MKYQNIASMGLALLGSAATVSASPLVLRGNSGVCPKGYSPTVITMSVPITATPTPVAIEEPTSTPSTPAPVTETQTPIQIETSAPVGYVAAISSSVAPTTEASVPETTEASVPETTQAAVVVTTSSSQAPVVHAAVSTTSSVAEEATVSQTPVAQSKQASSSSSSGGSSGEATFYGGNVAGGTCSFSGYTIPSNLFGTAFSGAVWDNAAQCGSCVAVTGPNGKTIKAMVRPLKQKPCPTNKFENR
jgi:hypothetical protein